MLGNSKNVEYKQCKVKANNKRKEVNMYTLEKSRRVKQLEQLEVENTLKKLEKYKKLFQQDNKESK